MWRLIFDRMAAPIRDCVFYAIREAPCGQMWAWKQYTIQRETNLALIDALNQFGSRGSEINNIAAQWRVYLSRVRGKAQRCKKFLNMVKDDWCFFFHFIAYGIHLMVNHVNCQLK